MPPGNRFARGIDGFIFQFGKSLAEKTSEFIEIPSEKILLHGFWGEAVR